MALETIDTDRGKIVTGTAKMRGVGKCDRICIGSGNCMTVQTFREAVLIAARAFEHSFIALVLEEFHVIAPHEVGVFDAGITPAHWNERQQGITDGVAFLCKNHSTRAAYANQHNRQQGDADVAPIHGLLSQPHLDVA